MKLKRIVLSTAMGICGMSAYAQQLPNSFNYQAVVNADDGSPVAAKEITVEVSILKGSDCDNGGCPVLWQELHTPTTNEFGLFTVEIGAASATNTTIGSAAKFSDINWLDVSDGYYYLKVRADFGESEFLNGMSDLGISKFSAVPYSLVALTTDQAERLTKNADGKVAINLSELSDVTVPADAKDGQILVLKDGKWTVADAPKGGDGTPAPSITKLSELTGDVSISSPADNQVLTYSAGKWINKTPAAGGATVTKLSELTGDVLIKDPKSSNALVYNGTRWVNQAVSVEMKNITDIDFSKTILNSKQSLFFDISTRKWVNRLTTFADIDGVKLTSLAKDQILVWNGTNWVNSNQGSTWKENSSTDPKTLYTTDHRVGIGIDNPTELFQVQVKGNTNSVSSDGTHLKILGGCLLLAGGRQSVKNKVSGAIACNGDAGNCSIAFSGSGGTASASGVASIAFGYNVNTKGNDYAQVFGEGTLLIQGKNESVLACGKYNAAGENDLFCVGNGTETARANAFLITKDNKASVAGALVQTSDARLKTNINGIDNSLVSLMKLRGVTFNWDLAKRPNSDKALQYGFIAQEVEKVFPELVNTDANGYKSLNYIGVIPVLTEAVKEQQSEIEDLKKENQELKSALESLLKRVEALENK